MPQPRRCYWCGVLYSIDMFGIEPHQCRFRVEPPLLPFDPEFKVIPPDMKNSQDGLKRYRRYLASHFPQE